MRPNPSTPGMHAIPPRRIDLDWLRIIAFGLLIFYHVGCFYFAWPWHANSKYASWSIAPLLQLTTPWRLLLLFVISGVATRFMIDKMSTGDFLASRSTRLLIPLAFGMLVIVPPQTYVFLIEQAGYRHSFSSFYVPAITGTGNWVVDGYHVLTPEWAHLWFLPYLFAFTLLTLAIGPWLKSRPASAFTWFTRGPWIFVAPVAFIAAANALIGPISVDRHVFIGDWRNVLVFGSAMVLGYSLAKHEPFFVAAERHRYIALAIAVGAYCTIQILWAFGKYEHMGYRYYLLFALLKPMQGWAVVLAAFGFARRYLRRDGPVRRYLTHAIFPYYIIHQTTIVVAGHWLTGMNLPAHIEATSLIIITIASCVIGYEIVRRVWLLRPLFGLKLEPAALKEPKNSAARPI